ncbi:MAG: type II secretion system F family protein [Rhizobacter sp.]
MQFRVLALDANASERRLVLDAADASAARRSAAKSGLAVLEIAPVSAGIGLFASGATARRFALDLFCQELLAMVQAGITVREALHTLADKERLSGTAGVIGNLLRAIEEGQPLSVGMAAQPAVFPLLLTESMRAAERTSDYAPALQRFVQYRRLAQQMRAKLVSAALYPMILLGVSGLVLLFLVGYVVPRFAQVYEDMGDRMPAASRVLMVIGQTLSGHPLLSAGVVAGLLVAAVMAWRAGAGLTLLKLVAGAVPRVRDTLMTIEMARLYRTLALLLSGGMPLVASLDLAAGVLPAATALRLRVARQRVSEGLPFADSLAAQGLTTLVAERFFRVGERTGRLAEMIDSAAEFHEEEVARAADWVGRVIGPLMMLVMGVVIGFVVVLMYMPIFQLTEMVQ